jgi:hypothetical protein
MPKPKRKAQENKPKPYRFLSLPAGFDPVDATVDEVASYRRESRWTVHLKLKDGRYEGYRDGRIRKIFFESVKRDRERTIAESRAAIAPVKRKPGRPKAKPEADNASAG